MSHVGMGAESRRRPPLLLLSTWHPMPADNGRKLRTKMLIDALSQDYEIVLVSMLSPEEPDSVGRVPVPGVVEQHRLDLPTFRPRSPRALTAAFQVYPRSTIVSWDERTAAAIRELVARHDPTIVIGTDMRTVRYLMALPATVPTILDEPDVSPFTGDEIDGTRARLRESKYRRLLHDAAERISLFIASSDEEVDAFRRLCPDGSIIRIPNGIDHVVRAVRPVPAGHDLLYTGSLTYWPNREAVEWFVTSILPRIRDIEPQASLTVTGRLPDEELPHLRAANVRLTGNVPDLDAEYARARVFVCPLRSGTGTRLKLLEAMANGIPIVSTTKGAEGLQTEDGVHLMLADSAESFARKVLQLFADASLSQRVGANGRSLVEERYTSLSIAPRIRDAVATVVEAPLRTSR